MKITDAAPRRRRLHQIFLDGEPAVKIDTETWLLSGLSVGDEIDDGTLHALLEKSAKHRAEEKALFLLEHRAHSKKELTEKIARAEYDRDAAAKAADRMEELGLLDDEAYARSLARELFGRKKFGARRVKQELRQKGIDEETAAAVLAEFAPEPDGARDAIREIIEKKYPAAFGDEKIRRRAVAALQRYGYSFEDIMAVLRAD